MATQSWEAEQARHGSLRRQGSRKGSRDRSEIHVDDMPTGSRLHNPSNYRRGPRESTVCCAPQGQLHLEAIAYTNPGTTRGRSRAYRIIPIHFACSCPRSSCDLNTVPLCHARIRCGNRRSLRRHGVLPRTQSVLSFPLDSRIPIALRWVTNRPTRLAIGPPCAPATSAFDRTPLHRPTKHFRLESETCPI